MFTGMVEELGTLETRERQRFRFVAARVLEGVALGDSIAVNGCCLTVVDFGDRWWEADVTDESLARTCLGNLRPGDPVNFERPVRLDDRLGGHLVQGHVDGVGKITNAAPDLQIQVPDDMCRYIVEKGSITVDGVSLTVVGVTENAFKVAIIPHTSEVTTLGCKDVGDPVNVEVDITVKYVEKLLAWKLDGETTEVRS